jgi:hypothetical protein
LNPIIGVMRGLDPRIHPLRLRVVAKKMDCRVKPTAVRFKFGID